MESKEFSRLRKKLDKTQKQIAQLLLCNESIGPCRTHGTAGEELSKKPSNQADRVRRAAPECGRHELLHGSCRDRATRVRGCPISSP